MENVRARDLRCASALHWVNAASFGAVLVACRPLLRTARSRCDKSRHRRLSPCTLPHACSPLDVVFSTFDGAIAADIIAADIISRAYMLLMLLRDDAAGLWWASTSLDQWPDGGKANSKEVKRIVDDFAPQVLVLWELLVSMPDATSLLCGARE